MAEKEIRDMTTLTQARLKEILEYDPADGSFNWRMRVHKAGSEQHGYLLIRIDGKLYRANRLAWLYMTGEWPPLMVDHKDLNGRNNAWSNLRLATNSQNKMNSAIYKNNASGYKGVAFHKRTNKWQADIRVNGKKIYLGLHENPEAAHAAYCEAAAKHFKEFARSA